jgi:hypothetical protein
MKNTATNTSARMRAGTMAFMIPPSGRSRTEAAPAAPPSTRQVSRRARKVAIGPSFGLDAGPEEGLGGETFMGVNPAK